ncbi:PTS sugar transporter subunit IIA [Fusobacterium perfoetens]|uniref:PTS sugar transporter subunit IIA n=1 Tax=Fusobacterium perfoetens TaxID=852 RepID=UPI000489971D|nr:PTS sugar transporter subunit IIA [Fusobacterium perfoetens]MCI6152177.1 PTS sugar transporter subunit IIA [Fusobacterium perfoetens]MDY3237932.1 PTS sugar transporter subunit IIA [Fusobacterium perfoetens]
MELIVKNRVLLDKTFSNKEEAIKEMAKLFLEEGIVEDYDKYVESLFDRENIAPTAVGYEVGLPHGKSDAVTRPAVAFARLNEEILWDSEENENAKFIFMLAIPNAAAGNEHINILVNLSKKILDDDFRDLITKATSTEEIVKAINE